MHTCNENGLSLCRVRAAKTLHFPNVIGYTSLHNRQKEKAARYQCFELSEPSLDRKTCCIDLPLYPALENSSLY